MFEGLLNSRLVVRARRVITEQAWWAIILVSLVGGLAALVLSAYPFSQEGLLGRYVKPEDLKELFKSVGTALLSGGVFASILKALQFSQVFQEELAAVIYEPKFLERRTDIEAVWGDVSDILYKRKFPAISKQIKQTILATYFPTQVNFYYEGFHQDIEYRFLDDSFEYMSVTEIIKFTVKPVSKTEVIQLPYASTILKRPNDRRTDYQLLEVKINDEPRAVVDQKEDKKDSLVSSLSLELSGADEYAVFIRHQKVLCPDVDNHKTFTTSKIIHQFKVDVRFPGGINMRFFPMGTPEEYKDEGGSENRIWQSYRGLIFPNQGYRIVLSRGPSS